MAWRGGDEVEVDVGQQGDPTLNLREGAKRVSKTGVLCFAQLPVSLRLWQSGWL
jgi:hypothetical protein